MIKKTHNIKLTAMILISFIFLILLISTTYASAADYYITYDRGNGKYLSGSYTRKFGVDNTSQTVYEHMIRTPGEVGIEANATGWYFNYWNAIPKSGTTMKWHWKWILNNNPNQYISNNRVYINGAQDWTLHAVFSPQITVHYNSNGGTIPDSPHLSGTNYFKIIKGAQGSGNLYQSTSANGTYNYTVTTVNAATVEPNYYPNLWNVSSFGLVKTGYHIDGTKAWSTAPSGGTPLNQDYTSSSKTNPVTSKILNGGNSEPTAHITKTIYANWIPNTATISFDANGGEGLMEDQNYTYDNTLTIKKNEFVNRGYNFVGWNTKRDGSGTAYADEANIKTAFPDDNSKIKLYAQWEDKERFGDFSIEGDTTVNGYQFEKVYTQEDTLRVTASLKNDQFYSIFGLDDESQFVTKENGNSLLKPAAK